MKDKDLRKIDEKWHARKETDYKEKNDIRSASLIDVSRVIHSFSFRRLQGKMQVLEVDQGDFHRTRLTHSIEVATIVRVIAKKVKKIISDEKDTNYKKLIP